MCHHKQMWQYLKPSPAHHLPTCVMPSVGIITSNLMRRKRPGKIIFVFAWKNRMLSELKLGVFTWQVRVQDILVLLGYFSMTWEGPRDQNPPVFHVAGRMWPYWRKKLVSLGNRKFYSSHTEDYNLRKTPPKPDNCSLHISKIRPYIH